MPRGINTYLEQQCHREQPHPCCPVPLPRTPSRSSLRKTKAKPMMHAHSCVVLLFFWPKVVFLKGMQLSVCVSIKKWGG